MMVILPLLAAVDPAIVAGVVTAVLSGSVLGAYAAFRKSGPEADQIAAKTLILVNEELRKDRARLQEEHSRELETRDEQIRVLRERIAILEEKNRERNGYT